MTFGWEGFTLDHPDDWAPVALTGSRTQGYARIASPGRMILQVRWKKIPKGGDAQAFLNGYLGRLQRDASRARAEFKSERHEERGRTYYRYAGSSFGRGVFFQSSGDPRVFVVEVASTKNDSTQSLLRQAVESFRVGDDSDRWSAFGLDFSLPKGLSVERKEFLAGKTRLLLRGKGVRIVAERWGFGKELLQKHSIEDWAQAVLNLSRHTMDRSGDSLAFDQVGGMLRANSRALVVPQLPRNQIILLHSRYRDVRWRPDWDWLN